MKRILTGLLFVYGVALCSFSAMGSEVEANDLLAPLDVKGGLCLMVGATNLDLSASLATNSTMYIEFVQSNTNTATTIAAVAAVSDYRESIGIRNSILSTNDYTSDLFSLIVVEDNNELGTLDMSDLYRILSPNGVIAFRSAPASFITDAASLGMSNLVVASFNNSFRCPSKSFEWTLPVLVKWESGPSSQIASGFVAPASADGKLVYMERLEKEGGTLASSGVAIIARDAYNGRTLWSVKAEGDWGYYNRLVANEKYVFFKTTEPEIVCLDIDTGSFVTNVASVAGGVNPQVRCINENILYVGGKFYDADTFDYLWTVPYVSYQPLAETVIGTNAYFCDGVDV